MATPSIVSITPNFCAQNTQETITIVGTNLSSFSKVYFGDVEASNVVVTPPTSLTATAPVFPIASSCDVTIKNITGEVSAKTDKSVFYFLPSEAGLATIDANNEFFDSTKNYVVFGTWNFKVPPKGIVVSEGNGVFDNLTVNVQSNFKGASIFSGIVEALGLETINLHSSINNILTTDGTFNMASVNSYIRLECLNDALQLESKGLSAKFLTSNAAIYGDGTNDFYLGSEGVPPVAADRFKDVKIDAAQLLSLRAGATVGIISNGTIQIGDSNTNTITLGSTNTDFIFSTDTTKVFKIGGLPSIAPGGTLKPLLIETDGLDKGKIYIST